VKILALSDVHGRFDAFPADKMPDADLAIVCGDITDAGINDPPALARAEKWVARLVKEYGRVLYVRGNHDIGLDKHYFEAWGAYALTPDDYAVFDDWDKAGGREVTITGAELSPCFDLPELERYWWHMTASREKDAQYYADLTEADIVVSHCPPYGYVCDEVPFYHGHGGHIGSPGLTAYIERVKPKLVVCGHVHECSGNEVFINHDDGTHTRVVNVAQTYKVIEV
jgi:Icc-related predicted phosphoesterase